jgi:hypothetical protein
VTQCEYFDGMSNARCCYHAGHSGDHYCSNQDETNRIRWKLAADEREDLRHQLAAANAEIERLRGRVLQPLTEREIQDALHEGRAVAMAATGDNAWTSLLKQRDDARQQLAAMTAARNEACDIASRWTLYCAEDRMRNRGGDQERIAELRKVGTP